MLSQRRQQSVPPLIADRGRLLLEQRGLNGGWLPPVLFEELPHQPPRIIDH
jgi:hypothetical protein